VWISVDSAWLRLRQTIALPVYAVALVLSYLSDALGRLAAWIALLALGVESDTEQTTLPRICCVLHSEMQCGEKMQDLEKMAAKLLETARKLPPGAEQHALLEQIRTFRIKLSAVAAKRKELQSASQVGPWPSRTIRKSFMRFMLSLWRVSTSTPIERVRALRSAKAVGSLIRCRNGSALISGSILTASWASNWQTNIPYPHLSK
jgi:hypothetical protein